MESLSDKARGYIVVRIVGAEPARFLEECAGRMVEFWDAGPEDEFTLVMSMRQKDESELESLAQKSACDVQVLERRGGRACMNRAGRRFVLWLLPVLFAALLILSSFFIWKIEITGNETISETEIRNVLAGCGVRIGSFWPGFTSESIRTKALLEIPELKWLSVSVFGSRAYVEVRERTQIPELFNEREYYKIIADNTGIIEKMFVLRGVRALSEGEAAVAGEALIDGVVTSEYGAETRFVHASGSVTARTWYEMSAVMPMEYTKKVYTGDTKSRYSIKFGDKRINFYRSSGILSAMCDNIISERALGIEGLFTLPITIIRETSEEYELRQVSCSETTARELLEARLYEELLYKIGEEGEIISAELTFNVVSGNALATLRAECRQNIAKEVPLTEDEMYQAKAQDEARNAEE